MADDFGLSSPRLQYLNWKRGFLSKFLDSKVWEGNFGSKERFLAVSGLLDYLKRTRSLAEDFPQISNEVTIDNKDLVTQHILPLSQSLPPQQ